MNRARFAFALLWVLPMVGCGGSASNEETQSNAPVEHMAVGVVNSIDQAAGTINISHGAVPSAGWPEMTMSFKLADPSAADDLRPGERVDFHFKIDNGMDATVTLIAPLN